jgi:hypothetical protein
MAGDAARDQGPDTDPSFAIPAHPERRFPYDEGVTYEGGTTFVLTPRRAPRGDGDGDGDGDGNREHPGDSNLATLVEQVLGSGPYRFGDFFDLPMPVFLVRDDETTDVFRVSIRDGRIRLHVLPETGSAGLRAFYDRLVEHGNAEWRVDDRTEG